MLNTKNIIIVTDREKGIVNAISKIFSDCTHFFCHNHLLQDIKHWLPKVGGLQSDKIGFKTNLENDLRKSSQGNLRLAGVSGGRLTTNISESMNRVIKRCTEGQNMKLDKMVLIAHRLFFNSWTEIKRGLEGLGEYILEKDCKKIKKSFFIKSEDIIPYDEEKTIKMVNGQVALRSFPPLQRNLCTATKLNLARTLVNENRVKLDSETGVFIVHGLTGKANAVKLKPNMCSCGDNSHECIHLLACRLATRMEELPDVKKIDVPLSVLCKRRRAKKKSGKKGPLTKAEINIQPARDSQFCNNSSAHELEKKITTPPLMSSKRLQKRKSTEKIPNDNHKKRKLTAVVTHELEENITLPPPQINSKRLKKRKSTEKIAQEKKERNWTAVPNVPPPPKCASPQLERCNGMKTRSNQNPIIRKHSSMHLPFQKRFIPTAHASLLETHVSIEQ